MESGREGRTLPLSVPLFKRGNGTEKRTQKCGLYGRGPEEKGEIPAGQAAFLAGEERRSRGFRRPLWAGTLWNREGVPAYFHRGKADGRHRKPVESGIPICKTRGTKEMKENKNRDRNAACGAGEKTRRLRRALVSMLALLCLLWASLPVSYGASRPRVTLEGVEQEGKLAVTLRVSDLTFNAMQFHLRYDPAVLALCSPETGDVIEGTVEGLALRQAGSPVTFLEPFYSARGGGWIDAGTFAAVSAGQAASLAGEGELRFLISVNQATKDEKMVTNDGGAKFIEAGNGGVDLLQIWFTVTGTLGEDSLRLAPSGKDTGLLLSAYHPKGGIIGYRDPGLADVILPGVGTINQTDGNTYEEEYSGGSGEGGDIEWEEPDGGSGSGSGGSTGAGGSGTGTPGSATPGSGSQTGSGAQTGGGQAAAGTGSGGNAASYTDLQGHWAQASLTSLIEKGLISGYPDQTVRPEDTLTRAEFCVVLTKALGYTPTPESGFDDVSRHWANGYIGAVHSMGIAGGTGPRTFSPDLGITREELTVMVVKARGWTAAGDVQPAFTDQSGISDWAVEAVKAAREKGIIGGYEDGSFRPQQQVTRAEMAVIVEKLLATAD